MEKINEVELHKKIKKALGHIGVPYPDFEFRPVFHTITSMGGATQASYEKHLITIRFEIKLED